MHDIKFSVLISVYDNDNPDYLLLALNSIWYDQILKPNEIVLVKDGPISNSLDATIKKFENPNIPLKSIQLPSNLGLGNALSIGLIECSNDLVARMDSDDISKPNRFLKQVDHFSKHDTDVLGSWVDEFQDNMLNKVSVRKAPEKHIECIKKLRFTSPFNHPSVMFKKSSVILAGNYMELFLKEDTYLWVRMAVHNFKFANIQDSLLYFRLSKNMYKRRRGIKYVRSEIKIYNTLLNTKLISQIEYLFLLPLIIFIRLLPHILLRVFYKKIVRKILN